MMKQQMYVLVGVFFLTGCAAIGTYQFEREFGKPQPRERVEESLAPGMVDYWSEVKPILERRCVVCHGCYDAPCQLKLTSIEGIERGSTTARVYDTSRLSAGQPTRLHEDADSVQGWRARGFHPVLNEYPDSTDANREASLMYQMLQMKRSHPLPDESLLPVGFDVSLNRKEQCPTAESFDGFSRAFPLWGMPFALPGLQADESDTIMSWVAQGAPYIARPELEDRYLDLITVWEKFLNRDSLKAQLMSRYVYEHLFLAHVYFDEGEDPRYFKLVRSKTAPGDPIALVSTRRPFDDPGVERVYYRLREERETILDKTHMPYLLNPERMVRWRGLFLDEEYEVTALPSYELALASNPFATFDQIPVRSRYKFMLDEAQYTIMNFIKGPVCRGQVALNVINDHFWIVFVNPDLPEWTEASEFLGAQAENLRLPAADAGNVLTPLVHWKKYSKKQQRFLLNEAEFLHENFGDPAAVTLDLIWDGDGWNDNAALTVFRHFDSATVEKGFLGNPPKTAWFVGYSLLERIHYLLVAGYDVYGNLGHQLITRVYMDFLRMEAESGFLTAIPEPYRSRELDHWYRGAHEDVKKFLEVPRVEYEIEPGIHYETDDPKLELYRMLHERLASVLPTEHRLESVTDPAIREPLARLDQLRGLAVAHLPELTFLEVRGEEGSTYFSLVRNNAHKNISSIFKESENRVPEEDDLSAIPGFIGSYPNVFLVVNERDLGKFVDAVEVLSSEVDYATLLDRYAVRRTDPEFWAQSDVVHEALYRLRPTRSGLLDYNRLENR